MAFETMTPNMNLTLPGVGLTSGPQWATDVNTTITVIDAHDHTPGNGVFITPAAISINSDLTFVNNRATNLKAAKFYPQFSALTSASDTGELYVLSPDLYYIDTNGNAIRLTQNGSIAGSSGSISGLTPPASASYTSVGTVFIFQSNTNTPANMSIGSLILGNISSSGYGLTLSPPTLTGNYTLTLPTIPPSNNLMTLDTSGNMNTALVGSTLFLTHTGTPGEVFTLDVGTNALTQANYALRGVVGSGGTAPAGGVAVSSAMNFSQSTNGTAFGPNAQLTCTNRPVMLAVTSAGSTAGSILAEYTVSNTGSAASGFLELRKNGTTIYSQQIANFVNPPIRGNNEYIYFSPFQFIDYNATTGVQVYALSLTISGLSGSISLTLSINNMLLTAYEIT